MTTTTHSHKAWTDKGGHVSPAFGVRATGGDSGGGAVGSGDHHAHREVPRRCGTDGPGQGRCPGIPILSTGALAQDLEHQPPGEAQRRTERGAQRSCPSNPAPASSGSSPTPPPSSAWWEPCCSSSRRSGSWRGAGSSLNCRWPSWTAATPRARINLKLHLLQLPDDGSQIRSQASGFTPLQGTLPKSAMTHKEKNALSPAVAAQLSRRRVSGLALALTAGWP